MRIVADENIPLAGEAFGTLGEVTLLPGSAIDAAAVRDADALLVRSVTRVDRALVEGSRLRFVGTATIGTDHLDVPALHAAGIAHASAPGSNAESVVEWVLAALLRMCTTQGRGVDGLEVGIVGLGAIGGRLAPRLRALGARVLACDPPLARAARARGEAPAFVALAELLGRADVVTCHVPLTLAGPDATHHLIDAAALERMRPSAWLLNASRGPVVDNAALLDALDAGRVGAAALDVWEGEPTPLPPLVDACAVATPHIAGYSYDGKVAGTVMLYHALAEALGVEAAWTPEAALAEAPGVLRLQPVEADDDRVWLQALVAQMYPIDTDDAGLREVVHLPPAARAAAFRALRKHYPRRRAFGRHALPAGGLGERRRRLAAEGLGVRLVDA